MAMEHFASSLSAVGSFFGFSERWAAQLRTRPGFPLKTADGYPLGEIARWLKAGDSVTEDKESLQRRMLAADVRCKELEAELRQLKRDQLEGSLVDREACIRELAKICAYLRSRLLSQPREHAMIFPAEIRSEAVETWETSNRNLCVELASRSTKVVPDKPDDNDE